MDVDLMQLSNEIGNERDNMVGPAVESFATERIQDFRTRKRRLLRENAFEQFVLDYIGEERDAAQRDNRDKPLCECGTLCAIKRGEVPPAVLLESNFADGVTRLKRQHNGTPVVVIEAADAFAEYYAKTLAIGEEALVTLRRDEVVTLEHGPDDDAADAAAGESAEAGADD